MAHGRKSRPDPGLGCWIKVFTTFQGAASSIGSGQWSLGPSPEGMHGSYHTGVPRSSETAPPDRPTVGPRLRTVGGLRGVGVSYGRGTPEFAIRNEGIRVKALGCQVLGRGLGERGYGLVF